jgi:ubiquinone/menaquinone biosynthesis C-methylase UbiE
MSKDNDSTAHPFNHNTGWKSRSVAEHYDERRFTSFGGWLYDRMEKHVVASCLDAGQKIAPINSVLDLACGTGRMSEYLATRGYQLACGDISEEMLGVAKKRLSLAGFNDVVFFQLDIYKTGQADGSHDCVTAFRLFQHLTSEQRGQALREMARVSRRFVLVNMMYTSAYYRFVTKLRRILGRYTTRYTSSRSEIDQEVGYAGLRIVKSVFTQPGFNGDLVLLLEKSEGHD